MERANKLREERRTQSVESADFSFTPQLVARQPDGPAPGSDHVGNPSSGAYAAPSGVGAAPPESLGVGAAQAGRYGARQGQPPSELDQLHALGDAKHGRPAASLDRLASDSLDQFYAAEGARLQGKENARMDPNFGTLSRDGGRVNNNNVFEASSLASPSNDSLGQELRRQGSSSRARGQPPAGGMQPAGPPASPYSSRYGQELYQEGVIAPPQGYQGPPDERTSRNQGRPDLFAQAFPDQVDPTQQPIDAHDTFSASLRSPEQPRGRGRGRRSRQREEAPEWNADTNVDYGDPANAEPTVGGGSEVIGMAPTIPGLETQRRGRGRGRGRGKEGSSQGPAPSVDRPVPPAAEADRPAWVGVGDAGESQHPAWTTFDEDSEGAHEGQRHAARGGPPRRQSSLSNLKARMKSREASRGSNVRHSRSADSQADQRQPRTGGFGWRAQTSPDVPQPEPFSAPSRPSRPAPKAPTLAEAPPAHGEERRKMLQQHQQQPKATYRGMYMPSSAGGAPLRTAEPPSQPPPRRPPMPQPEDHQKREDAPVGGGGGMGGGDYFSAMMEKALAQGAFPEGQVPDGLMDAPVDSAPLVECSSCGRRMTEKALVSHTKACVKVFQTKRKRFDSTKARVEGTEAAKFVKDARRKQRLGGGRQQQQPQKAASGKSAKWRSQSEQFREAMRAARGIQNAEKTGAPLPAPSMRSGPDPSLVPCPHCGRRFNELAAERHIPRCKDIKAKPTTLKRGTRVPLGTGARQASEKRSSTGGGFRR